MPPHPLTKSTFKRLADEYELRRFAPDTPRSRVTKNVLGALVASAASLRRSGIAMAEGRRARQCRMRAAAFERLHPLRPDDWGLSCALSIGDVYLYASFAKALLAHRGGGRVLFCTKPEHAFIPRLFPSISETIAIAPPFNPSEIGRKPGKTWLDPDGDRGHYLKPGWGSLDMLGYGENSFLDCLRADLRLPADAQPERPLAPSIEEFADACAWLKSNGLEPGRVAILSPDASATRGIPTIPDTVWAKLINAMRLSGISCVTNVGGPTCRVLEGAPALPIPLERIRAIAWAAGYVVANRSGLCDLLCDLPLALAVLFPAANFCGGRLFPATSLRAMNWEGANLIEQEIDCARPDDALDRLLAALQLSNDEKAD